MKTLIERRIEENGEHRKVGYLPDMCRNSTSHLDALASESFSERVISAVNLLVYFHHIHLDHDDADKMVTMRMSERIINRVQLEEMITSISF